MAWLAGARIDPRSRVSRKMNRGAETRNVKRIASPRLRATTDLSRRPALGGEVAVVSGRVGLVITHGHTVCNPYESFPGRVDVP